MSETDRKKKCRKCVKEIDYEGGGVDVVYEDNSCESVLAIKANYCYRCGKKLTKGKRGGE